MLLQFQVSNHRSIHDPAELSMIAIDQDRVAVRSFELFNEKVLTVAGIYGANASGKTSILKAIQWLADATNNSLTWDENKRIPTEPFQPDGRNQPTTFDVDFIADGVRHHYTLTVNRREVLHESLCSYPHQRPRTLFTREGGSIKFRRETRIPRRTQRMIELLAAPATLVMSVHDSLPDEFQAAVRFLGNIHTASNPHFISNHATGCVHNTDLNTGWQQTLTRIFGAASEDETRQLAVALLRCADIGVENVEVTSETDYHTEHTGPRIRLLRENYPRYSFELCEESAGTRAWLSLLPSLIQVFTEGGLVLVDDFGSGIHPDVTEQVLKLFHNPKVNSCYGQIVFTSHDVSLIAHLNRDELWMTDPHPNGSTKLTPLSDFRGRRVRTSANLMHGYLAGRYGGTPIVDSWRVAAITQNS